MKVELLTVHTTIQVDEDQIDICYNFRTSELEIFINGTTVTHYHFNPARTVFSTINMISIAVEIREKWKKRQQLENDE